MTIDPPPVPGGVGAPSGAEWLRHNPGATLPYAGISAVRVLFGAAAGATSYESEYRYNRSIFGMTPWLPGRAVSPGSWEYVASCLNSDHEVFYDPQVRVRGVNAYGAGPWTTWSTPTNLGVGWGCE